MSNCDIKILIAYHKPDVVFKNDYLIPIHVGRAVLRRKEDEESRKNLRILEEQMIGDDTGENISEKNPSYNEMTALYWAWKNYDMLGSPSYIGLMHYRRHFCIKKMGEKSAYFECGHCDDPNAYIREELGLTKDALEELLEKNDFIIGKPYYKNSVYEHYRENHKIEELDHAIRIVKEKFPRYYKSLKRYIRGNDTYFCNMFIFPKDIFFEYCEFVFGVLQQYETETDITGKRLFISERLTGAFVRYLLDKGKKGANVPTMFLEERLTIPVALATDLNFVVPTFAAIASLLQNAKPSTFYDINILAEGEAAEYVREQSIGFEARYKNFKINVIDMGREFSDVHMSIGHITPTTYYRLHLPKILKDYAKCLYLDSDITVNTDLSELYRTNIDDYYVAGVRAAGYYYPEDWVLRHTHEVGLPSIGQYINAGVLLMNLARLRNEKVCEKMLSYVGKGFSSQDQDIINLVCYNNIKILPPKYNLMTKYLRYENGKIVFSEQNRQVYGAFDSDEALEKPVIIHYADKIKPWEDSSIVFFEEWMRCAKLSPLYKERAKSKVAVIVPIYNMEKYLGDCLDSIFSQTLREIEVVCINDGSQDNSLKILFEYQKKYSNLFIINQKNQGVAAARNAGLDFANSEFVCFMDPDDFYPDIDILETLYENAIQQGVKICGGSWMEQNETDGMICRKTEFIGAYSGYTFRQNGIVEYKDYQFDFGYHRFIYSLDMIRENDIRFPLYSRFQDPPFFVYCMLAAQRFYAMEKIVYCYRIGQQRDIYKGKKLRDFLLGNIDNLRVSGKYGLAHLHRITFDRLNKQMSELLYERVIYGDDPMLIELLVRANTAIDRELLQQELPAITENTTLVPLQRVLKYFSERAARGLIRHDVPSWRRKLKKNIKAGWAYYRRYGFACTFVRVFGGWEKAENYKRKHFGNYRKKG